MNTLGKHAAPARNMRGVTLLELMLVVTFVAVLGAFAIPAFTGYVQRANTSQALADVASMNITIKQFETNTGALPINLAAVGLAGRTDPWGNLYQYSNVPTRTDQNGTVVNTDFDLYSFGPNGVSGLALNDPSSLDDIVRANSGAYVGKAEDY